MSKSINEIINSISSDGIEAKRKKRALEAEQRKKEAEEKRAAGAQAAAGEEPEEELVPEGMTEEEFISQCRTKGNTSAKEGDYSKAAYYYARIMEVDPTDWLARYNEALYRAWGSDLTRLRLDNYREEAASIFNRIKVGAISGVDIDAWRLKIAEDSDKVAKHFVNLAKRQYDIQWKRATDAAEYWQRLLICFRTWDHALVVLDEEFISRSEEGKNIKLSILKSLCQWVPELLLHRSVLAGEADGKPVYQKIAYRDENRIQAIRLFEQYAAEIKKYDPQYKPPAIVRQGVTNNQGGCYIATAVYGSYDCPEVWTLRRYRDTVLKRSLRGRMFIKVYYALSPGFIKLFGKTRTFNRFFRSRLDKWVAKLNKEGMRNTPYEDE